jgi:hypothetical protein
MNPTFFYQSVILSSNDFITFDTKPSVKNNLFLINRSTDDAQSSFTNTQLTDGTYSNFISGTTGKITNIDYSRTSLIQTVTTNKPLLIQNINDPFIDCSGTQSLVGNHNLILKRDFIFTMICNKEFNTNSQRQNFGLLSSNNCYFSVLLTGNSVNVVANVPAANTITPAATKSIDNIEDFRLITVTYLNGVINVYKNNVLLSDGGTAFSLGTSAFYNKIILGGRGDGSSKVNKYKHFSVRTQADLTSFNVSAYNQSVMSKYSIT